ncbi:MAG: hypothetical protein ACD_12C00806G0008 [uncultured bacterium]|nr:MAG: hypothetical protein ACD_12C00806G0008 [uncultured bacterium]
MKLLLDFTFLHLTKKPSFSEGNFTKKHPPYTGVVQVQTITFWIFIILNIHLIFL